MSKVAQNLEFANMQTCLAIAYYSNSYANNGKSNWAKEFIASYIRITCKLTKCSGTSDKITNDTEQVFEGLNWTIELVLIQCQCHEVTFNEQ